VRLRPGRGEVAESSACPTASAKSLRAATIVGNRSAESQRGGAATKAALAVKGMP
jgi:hypothetical protein